MPVAVLQGRAHLYEGIDRRAIAPCRCARVRALGAERCAHQRRRLAARRGRPRPPHGADRPHQPDWAPTRSTGPNDDALGPRFVGLATPTTPSCARRLRAAAAGRGRRRCPRASTSRSPARASRRPPRSARSASSAPTPSACRPSPRSSSPATAACASPRSRRSPTSPRAWATRCSRHEQHAASAAVAAASDLAPPARRFVEDLRVSERAVAAASTSRASDDDDTTRERSPRSARAGADAARAGRRGLRLPRLRRRRAASALRGSPVRVATVANFPAGA